MKLDIFCEVQKAKESRGEDWQHTLIEENYEPNTPPAALETAGKDGWEAVGMAVYGGRIIVLCKRPGD